MKNSAYYRSVARDLMDKRWKIFGVIMLLFTLINLALSAIPYIGTFATFLVSGAFSLSASLIALAYIKGQDVAIENMFDGFKNYTNATILALHQGIVIFLWTLLFIIPGIIKSYSYQMVFYILAENPGMSSKEAMEESKSLMEGHRFELFKLQLSFIGWSFLSIFTFGILLIWLVPYVNIATAVFYTDLKMAKYGTADPYTEKTAEPVSESAFTEEPSEQFKSEQQEVYDFSEQNAYSEEENMTTSPEAIQDEE